MAGMTQTAPESALEHIHAPLGVIHRLFETHASENAGGYSASDFGKLAQTHFQSVFGGSNAVKRIPVYDQAQTELKSGSLVRFRCMVQDPGYGEELHLSVARVMNCETGEQQQKFSQYTDAEHRLDDGWEVDYGSAANVFTEKEVAYCVSVPGQSAWAQLEADSLESAMEAMSLGGGGSSRFAQSAEKYPIPGQRHSAALVKFYAPSTAPKASTVIDVVGIFELGHNARARETGDESAAWPCIHAIYHREVQSHELLPALPPVQPSEYAGRRAMCLTHLASVLGGDELAAQYLLLHLLSKTVRVQDAKVGKLALNLIGVPAGSEPQPAEFAFGNRASRWVGEAVSQLVPFSVSVPFNLQLLNKSSFTPNAEQGDLRAGVLQLAPGTEVLCDETCLSEGTLDERGVRNLQAMQTAIIDQTVSYVYPFQPIEMPTSLRVLVLSTGKSILHSDCEVHVSESSRRFLASVARAGPPADVRPLDPMHSEQLRQYVELARHLDFGIPKDVSDHISGEYAASRRNAHSKGEAMVTQEELALTITVARLISVSKGESELSVESWADAVALEQRRKERNAQAKQKSTSKSAAPPS
ncbi:hypothetical protein LPJ63_004078 [Coemansia sp. RSA 2711]|nr:hypothetical protein LPJ63_004078 [Coemansia sp. RSA 2711]